jgi:hypothetical protein
MADIGAPGSPTGDQRDSTVQTAKDQTKQVGQTAVQAGSDVAQSAKEQGKEVVAEAGRQAQNLYHQARVQVSDQASTQQKRAVGGLYSLGDEMSRMAQQGGQNGPATQVARQASDKINQVAQWLESREPRHVFQEVKRYARNNPGTFLFGAAVLGVLAGRLTKNLTGDSDDNGVRATGSSGAGRYPAESGSYLSGATGSTLESGYAAESGYPPAGYAADYVETQPYSTGTQPGGEGTVYAGAEAGYAGGPEAAGYPQDPDLGYSTPDTAYAEPVDPMANTPTLPVPRDQESQR